MLKQLKNKRNLVFDKSIILKKLLASEKFQKAIDEIDKSINSLKNKRSLVK